MNKENNKRGKYNENYNLDRSIRKITSDYGR